MDLLTRSTSPLSNYNVLISKINTLLGAETGKKCYREAGMEGRKHQ